MTVISFPLETFRRLNAHFTAFYAQNIVNAVVSVDTSPPTRKTRSFVDLTKNVRNFLPVRDIPTYKRPTYCIRPAEHTARCTKHRNKPNNLPNAIIRRFERKMSVISIPLEIFRRINVRISAFYLQNIVHALLSVVTNPTTRTTRSFVDFDEK
jgi:hypothetical protein